MSHPVRAVGVGIPARDEAVHIGPCLEAVLTALDRLPPDIGTAVCLVVDRSRDATAALARRTVRRWADTHGSRTRVDVLVSGESSSIGGIRNRAAYTVLGRLGAVGPPAIRLLSTDADSLVPPDWAVAHLRLAGAAAASGGVLPDGPVPPGVLVPDGVYAANLGVGAEPFLQVGGFPEVHSGEDAGLLGALRAAGHHVVTCAGIHVRTSARTRGRATGGLADLLREHSAPEPA